MNHSRPLVLPVLLLVAHREARAQANGEESPFHLSIPKAWDDAAMAGLELPLAQPTASPKQVPAEFYYHLPLRPIRRVF